MTIVGYLLGGHFQVIDTLGGGGVGETYTAVDLHRPGQPICVVKRLKPSIDPDLVPVTRTLFNREAETLERLGHHDQIPRLLAYFEEKKEFFLVQEFVQGQPLSAELPPGHRWTESKVLQMLQDVLTVLEFVHRQGVIHRDIKPTNLIRRHQDHKLVLIDFGAVKQVRRDSSSGQTQINPTTISIGTEGYMPPEQLIRNPHKSSDIYALGMIGIQALTGTSPDQFQQDNEGDVVWRHLARTSDDFAAILTTMVRYHFRERYQSATETLQALQQYIDRKDTGSATTDQQQNYANDPAVEIKETKVVSQIDSVEIEPDHAIQLEIEAAQHSLEQDLSESNTALDNSPSQDDFESTHLESVIQPDLDIEKATSSNTELKETKVSLSPESVTQTNLPETKIVINSGQAQTKIALDSGKTQTPSETRSRILSEETLKEPPETEIRTPSYRSSQSSNSLKSDQGSSSDRTDSLIPTPDSGKFETRKRIAAGVAVVALVGAIAAIIGVVTHQAAILSSDQHSPEPTASLLSSIPLDSPKPDPTGQSVEQLDPFQADYDRLKAALNNKKWQEADQQTYELMLNIAGSRSAQQGYFDLQEWDNFSCEQFRKINKLWLDASDNTLGFSVQHEIFNQAKQDKQKYFRTIGWRSSTGEKIFQAIYDPSRQRAGFSKTHPNFKNPIRGHLPGTLLSWSDAKGKISSSDYRFEKSKACGL